LGKQASGVRIKAPRGAVLRRPPPCIDCACLRNQSTAHATSLAHLCPNCLIRSKGGLGPTVFGTAIATAVSAVEYDVLAPSAVECDVEKEVKRNQGTKRKADGEGTGSAGSAAKKAKKDTMLADDEGKKAGKIENKVKAGKKAGKIENKVKAGKSEIEIENEAKVISVNPLERMKAVREYAVSAFVKGHPQIAELETLDAQNRKSQAALEDFPRYYKKQRHMSPLNDWYLSEPVTVTMTRLQLLFHGHSIAREFDDAWLAKFTAKHTESISKAEHDRERLLFERLVLFFCC
jgi:hypothetical protein